MSKKLLLILSDYISSWIYKGEVIERYYNPGNLFDEVHILFTNDDKPDVSFLQPMVGDAKIFIYNYPEPPGFLKKTLGWQPFLMKKWANGAIEIAQRIKPDLIRCHGLFLNTFLAVEIKKKMQVPVITSLHGNPDVDYLRGRLARTWKDKIIGQCHGVIERYCLKYIDHVIAVYSPIVSYLEKHLVKSFSVIHNVVAINAPIKKNYNFDSNNVNLICVGRQTVLQKDPSNIIRALASLNKVNLTIIGDGDLHQGLIELANGLGVADRVKFIKNIDNKSILSLMQKSDFFIYHSINYEISKGCIEAALIGLPVILNDRNGNPANELVDSGFVLVKDDPNAYASALTEMINDDNLRKNTATSSHEYALKHWSPNVAEGKIVDLYKEYLVQ